jgi:hypothetical protein
MIKKDLTESELDNKIMQDLFTELKAKNIPTIDNEIYLSDGITINSSGDILESKKIVAKKGFLKNIHKVKKS